MRNRYVVLVVLAGMGMISCSRREQPAARQIGREAYDASQDIKRGAKKAAKELRNAGKELRQGWNEARREDPGKHKEKK
jgi:hypothetical protein